MPIIAGNCLSIFRTVHPRANGWHFLTRVGNKKADSHTKRRIAAHCIFAAGQKMRDRPEIINRF
jgi:hypothetical protein